MPAITRAQSKKTTIGTGTHTAATLDTCTMRAITLTFGAKGAYTIGTEEAAKIKARWEEEIAGDDVVVKKVDLSWRIWTADAIKVLRPVLEKVAPTIVILDIEGTLGMMHYSLVLEIMELFTEIFKNAKELEEILMSCNAIGPRGLKCMAPLLGAPKLKRANFENCGLSAETMPMLDEALMVRGTGPGMARLQGLVLGSNMIGVEGARFVGERLATWVNLTHFSFYGCRPTKEGTKHIVEGLKKLGENNPDVALANLTLEDCDFGDFSTLEVLGKALEKMPKLTHLNLAYAGDLEEEGAGIVAQALMTSNCKLVDFDLSECCLGQNGAETVAEMLRTKLDTLKVLKLEGNEMENDGIETILAAFHSENCLERLYLNENELDDSVIAILKDANLPKLRLLSLTDNMDLEEAEDEKKEELRSKFTSATVLISDDDKEVVEGVWVRHYRTDRLHFI